MKRLLGFILAGFAVMAGPALAQQTPEIANVIATCGTLGTAYTAGTNRPVTQNTSGQQCTTGTSTVSGTVTANQGTAGASSWPVALPGTAGAGTTTSASVGTSSAQALATGTRNFLMIQNPSSTANVACSFGGSAALNTAGSIMFPPGATMILDNSYIPNDAINCIASVASSPLTIVTR